MTRRRWIAAAWAGLLVACQGPGVPVSEISSDPIAIAWREPETARRHADFLASRDPETRSANHEERWRQVGVVPVDEVKPLLEGLMVTASGGEDLRHSTRLALLDPRTSKVEPIPVARPGARPEAWSPDRRRLLFSQPEARGLQLFEYDLDREDVRPLTPGRVLYPRGCYGPDGRFVVMTVATENARTVTRIALTDAAGLHPEPISPGPWDHSPTCAPDGSSVVYVATARPGRDQLFSVDAAGGKPRLLGPGRQPAFSPNGEWVVFSVRIGDRWQLWRIRPDGSGRARIGRGALDETQPTVSPDGRYVAYVVEENFRQYLYLRRIDGSGDRILFREGDTEHPAW